MEFKVLRSFALFIFYKDKANNLLKQIKKQHSEILIWEEKHM